MTIAEGFVQKFSTSITDREVTVEVQKISDILNSGSNTKSSGEDWKKRLEALKRLCTLAREDISKRHGFLLHMSTWIKVPLQRHIEEIRTVLSVEACAVVVAFAEYSSNRTAWQTMTEWFVPSLLSLTMRTTRVSVKSAAETLEVLAKTNSIGLGSFNELIRGCTAKHSSTRSNAFRVLQFVIQQSQNDDGEFPLSKHMDTLCRTLRSGLVDADAETRKYARGCYWSFHASEPEAAEVLCKGLENSVKRALEREKAMCSENKKKIPTTKKLAAVKVTDSANIEGIKESTPLPRTPQSNKKSELGTTPNSEFGKGSELNAAASWALLQDALRSTSWSQRLHGLRRLSEQFTYLHHKGECIKLLLPRLNDPNYRVAQAAIQAMQVVMRCTPALLKDELTELITALLVNLTGNKEVLLNASRELLVSIIKMPSVDDIAHAIYRSFCDVVAPKVKVHALEYVQYLYTQNTEHFAHITPMKLAMTQILLVLRSDKKNGDVYKAGVSALTTLYVIAKNTFHRALMQLTTGERDTVIEVLEIAVPHLIQECRRRSFGERPLQHPVPHVRSPFADALGKHVSVSPPRSGTKPENAKVVRSVQVTPNSAAKKKTPQNRKTRSSPSPVLGNEDGESPTCLNVGDTSVVRFSTTLAPSRNYESLLQTSTYYDPIPPASLPLSRRSVKDNIDDASAILDRLDEACGALDTCTFLDHINSMIVTNPKPWINVFGRLFMQLEKLVPQSAEPNHSVRRLGLLVLQNAVGTKVLRRCISRSLKRVLLLTRIGIDDVFPEVRMEAMALLQLILNSGLYPSDDCLNALAVSLETWLRSDSNYCSHGWLMLLESVEQVFRRLGRSVVLVQNNFSKSPISQDPPPGIIGEPVFHRVCSAVVRAVQHSVSEVRLTAVLVCVSIWMALDSAALPYFVDLTASQRKLISIYYNKIIAEQMPGLQSVPEQRDMSREMRVMGLPESICI
ncbi:CLASP N-terminal domain [Trypanosoma melophagium]|uniref:CLASP N-terminal domain n=1 Tax=Trypanosoma melophagium TaxID=715481 RepID=UPI00351A0FB3|nr:CLASP N-terminal domain [Trypanosoma melophagium]